MSEMSEMIAPQSRAYRERKARLQAEWRGRIFDRDGHRCRGCDREGTDDTLHLAHVTPALRFVRAAGSLEGLDASYREDNLITLCADCHKIQHRDVDSAFNPELSAFLAQAEEMRKRPEIQEWLALRRQIDDLFEKARQDAPRRRSRVEKVFQVVRSARGWKWIPEGFGNEPRDDPSWESLGYRPSERCYEPSGGPSKRKRVALGFCAYEAATCQGLPTRCEGCGLPYCAYHAPTHRRR